MNIKCPYAESIHRPDHIYHLQLKFYSDIRLLKSPTLTKAYLTSLEYLTTQWFFSLTLHIKNEDILLVLSVNVCAILFIYLFL